MPRWFLVLWLKAQAIASNASLMATTLSTVEKFSPVAGDVIALAAGTRICIIKGTNITTGAAITVNLPPTPADGMEVTVSRAITLNASITFAATGKTVVASGATTAIGATSWIYNDADLTWYRS